MNLYALLSWYDEPPELLVAAVEDAARIGCTDVLALDGRYRNYPGDTWISSPDEYQAIREACAKRNMRCVIEHIEDATEVDKRTRLFTMAYENGATREDWLFVQDADHKISRAVDLKPILEDADGDVFNVWGIEGDSARFTKDTQGRYVRLCFRAVPGLHVHPEAHWVYITGDDRILWGYNSIPACGDLPIVIHNRSQARTKTRRKGRDRYYEQRAKHNVEVHWTPTTCGMCPEPMQLPHINADITIGYRPDGTYGYAFRRGLYLCPEHRKKQQTRNTYELQRELERLHRTDPTIFHQVYPQIMDMLKTDGQQARPVFV